MEAGEPGAWKENNETANRMLPEAVRDFLVEGILVE